MGTCKTCKYWGASWDGVCDFINTIQAENVLNGIAIEIQAHDDTGVYASLKTGPYFGCIQHVPARKKDHD